MIRIFLLENIQILISGQINPLVLRIIDAAGFEQETDRHKPTLLSAVKPTEGRSRRIGSPKCLNRPVMGGSVLFCERFG